MTDAAQIQKLHITAAIKSCAANNLRDAAINLFHCLGYHSDHTLEVRDVQDFLNTFDQQHRLNHDAARVADWTDVQLLFQLSGDNITNTRQSTFAFEDPAPYQPAVIESYLFLAIDLRGDHYPRGALANITRAVNRIFAMPALILFRHNQRLTLAVINRRLHKRDRAKDVLEKVTLVKDVSIEDPHRAHIEILHDLALEQLQNRHACHTFIELHRAWQKTLDSAELNRRFFQEIANWYFWAVNTVTFPMPPTVADAHAYKAQCVIRLITRLIFCWFIKEKNLLPDAIFNPGIAPRLVKNDDPSAYYKAILQNLFFATLNQEMGKREFRRDNQHFMAHTLYRYKKLLNDPDAFLRLLNDVPFLNGGLFECLDNDLGENHAPRYLRVDGFSDRPDNPLHVPDELFFAGEHERDLNDAYGTRNRRYKVRGIIHILNRYKFTIEENTPIEEEIALDPELLGRVFENLLAAYNPETGATARKQTGSFYTPREIVNYMVDEALIARLDDLLQQQFPKDKKIEAKLRHLFAYNQEPHKFNEAQTRALIAAVDKLKILDPACGSGAFPMGVIHKLVFILAKLDPNNEHWKQRQIEKVEDIPDITIRDIVVEDIERAFRENELDYGRKLYLIENCIYGVDIQPVAVQIAKLRFLISLIVEQKTDPAKPNRGLRALPNLETKIVAANTLIPIERPKQLEMRSPQVEDKEKKLQHVRDRHFGAKTPATKRQCREQDAALRNEIAALLVQEGWNHDTAAALATWDPYHPDTAAEFFDPEWMFQVVDGFDVTIGNPPYVRAGEIKHLKNGLRPHYKCFTGTADLYVFFYERAVALLAPGGAFAFISSNKWYRAGYGTPLREWLTRNTRLLRILDFGDAPVFNAIAYPTIVIAQKRENPETPTKEETVRILNWTPGEPVESFPTVFESDNFTMPQLALKKEGWQLEPPGKRDLLERIRNAGTPLGEYVNGQFYYGIKTGLNEAFVIDGATRKQLIAEDPKSEEIIKPFLRGRDIKRWRVDFADQYLIKIESSENKQHPWTGKDEQSAEQIFAKCYPAIYAHFQNHREKLIARYDQGRYFWELRACAYWAEFEKPKLIVPAIAERPSFAPDITGHYSNNKSTIYITDAVHYCLGVLNSSVNQWLSTQVCATKQRAYYDFEPRYSSQLIVPKATERQQEMIAAVVNTILAAQNTDYERLLNALVYELFFPDDLHQEGLHFFDAIEKAGDLQKLLSAGHEPDDNGNISFKNHPVIKMIEDLNKVDIVCIIEAGRSVEKDDTR